MLTIRDLTSNYGRVQVLHGVSLDVGPGEVLALLGRNGAGKTTALKTIMGLVAPTGGSIQLEGDELTGLRPDLIPKLGIGYVPQGRRLFGEMTVEENLRIGSLVRPTSPNTLEVILELFPILTERMDQRSGSLSGGEQQMLAVARALCLEPKLLLMDEPSEGLMPAMVAKILETVRLLKARGVAVLFVEQKVEAALAVADRVLFIENGRIEASAMPAELHADPTLLQNHVGLSVKPTQP